ncbi:hypothetical protein BRPE64_BCDS03240 [Caballeronia insecticola]|uniref:Uncharacterized protein n=1 Tax=Caballeronia insecticola TaxID=758793 RepID=R4WVD7_9BURK|nr:hypothetical protein BRPE64_BCDS03240 [Caballeronia insecticola]
MVAREKGGIGAGLKRRLFCRTQRSAPSLIMPVIGAPGRF